MKRFSGHRIGVDQGDVVLSDFESGGPLWAGEGKRQTRVQVRFSEPFAATPAVQVGLAMWDISNAANMRVDVTAEEVTPEGFAVVFRTWADTRVARVRVGWTAIGPLSDEDEWELE